jgi:hypothetical protein
MAELIIPKPAVALAISVLKAGLSTAGFSGVFVGTRTPGPRTGHTALPKRFVRVTRTGGGMLNRVTDNARLLIECWSDDGVDAEALANAARAVLVASRGTKTAYGFVRGTGEVDDGPVDYPDPLVESHERYQFQVSLHVSTN